MIPVTLENLEIRLAKVEGSHRELQRAWIEHYADVRQALQTSERALVAASDALANVRTVLALRPEEPTPEEEAVAIKESHDLD